MRKEHNFDNIPGPARDSAASTRLLFGKRMMPWRKAGNPDNSKYSGLVQ